MQGLPSNPGSTPAELQLASTSGSTGLDPTAGDAATQDRSGGALPAGASSARLHSSSRMDTPFASTGAAIWDDVSNPTCLSDAGGTFPDITGL